MSNVDNLDQPGFIFYLYPQDGKYPNGKPKFDLSKTVPAKYLLRNGKRVPDPYPAGSDQQHLYTRLNADGTIDQSSQFDNTGNYLIVPASVGTFDSLTFADKIDTAIAKGGLGAGAIAMIQGFNKGGSEDYQRGVQYGIPRGEVGAAFKDSASENLVYVTALTPLANSSAEVLGGALNTAEYAADQGRSLWHIAKSWKKWFSWAFWKTANTATHKLPDGPFGMDQADASNFEAGVQSAQQLLLDNASDIQQTSKSPPDIATMVHSILKKFRESQLGQLHNAARNIGQRQSISFAPIQKNHNNQRAAASTQFNPAETSNDGRRALSIDEVLTITKQAQAYMETLPVPPSVLKEIALSHPWINNRPPPPPWLDTWPKRTLDDGQRDPNTPLSVHDILAIGRAARDNDRPNGYAPAAPSQCYPQSAMQMSFAPVRRPERAPARPSMAQPAGEETSRRNDGAPFGVPHPITQEEFREALSKHLDREARLPPSGPTGFDPRLSPAWPSLKSAN